VRLGGVMRIYQPDLSPYQLVFEIDWETEVEHHAYWNALNATPGMAESGAKWHDLVKSHVCDERWVVTEIR